MGIVLALFAIGCLCSAWWIGEVAHAANEERETEFDYHWPQENGMKGRM